MIAIAERVNARRPHRHHTLMSAALVTDIPHITRLASWHELDEEEKARRIMAEATRLAALSPGEWKIWIDGSAERLFRHAAAQVAPLEE